MSEKVSIKSLRAAADAARSDYFDRLAECNEANPALREFSKSMMGWSAIERCMEDGHLLRALTHAASLGEPLPEDLRKDTIDDAVMAGDIAAVKAFVRAQDGKPKDIFSGTHDTNALLLILGWDTALPHLPAPFSEWSWDAIAQYFEALYSTSDDREFIRERGRRYDLKRSSKTSVREVLVRGEYILIR